MSAFQQCSNQHSQFFERMWASQYRLKSDGKKMAAPHIYNLLSLSIEGPECLKKIKTVDLLKHQQKSRPKCKMGTAFV